MEINKQQNKTMHFQEIPIQIEITELDIHSLHVE